MVLIHRMGDRPDFDRNSARNGLYHGYMFLFSRFHGLLDQIDHWSVTTDECSVPVFHCHNDLSASLTSK